MIEKFKQWLNSKAENDGKKPSKKIRYLIVLGLLGLLLVIISNAFTTSSDPGNNDIPETTGNGQTDDDESEDAFSKKESSTSDVDKLETSYEKDLQAMLDKIQGVSDVEVMVNLDSTEVKVYEKDLITEGQTNEESDKNGGTRKVDDNSEETEVVVVREGDKEVPLLVQTKKPDVRGVFIVADGVDQTDIKKWVIDSAAKVLDVPTHQVSVMPKK